jgi:hypothetical protein
MLLENACKYIAKEVESKLLIQLMTPNFTQEQIRKKIRTLQNTPIFCLHYSPETKHIVSVVNVNPGGNIERFTTFNEHLLDQRQLKVDWNNPNQLKNPELGNREKICIEAMWQLKELIDTVHPSVVAITATCYMSRDILRVVQRVNSTIAIVSDFVFIPCDAAKI